MEIVEEHSPLSESSARVANVLSRSRKLRKSVLGEHDDAEVMEENSTATASSEEAGSRPSRYRRNDLARSGERAEGESGLQSVDLVAERRTETLSAETERTTSDTVAKQLAGMNEDIKNSTNEFVKPSRLPDAKRLKGTDQSHLQQTSPEEVPGNKSVLRSSKESSTPLPKRPVEDQDKYGTLVDIGSPSTRGESRVDGGERREGALSKIRRLFEMGSKQEGSRDGLVATDKVEKQEIAQGDVSSRSGSDESVHLPPRRRPIDSESDLKRKPDSHQPRRDSFDVPVGTSMLHADQPIIIEDRVRDRRRATDLAVEPIAADERAYRAVLRSQERRREEAEEAVRAYRAAMKESGRRRENGEAAAAERAYRAVMREGERRRGDEEATHRVSRAAMREREFRRQVEDTTLKEEEDRRVEMELRGRFLRERDLADRERRLAERERATLERHERAEMDHRAQGDAEARSRQRRSVAIVQQEQPSAPSNRGEEVIRRAQEDARRRRESHGLLVPEIGRRRDVARRSPSITMFDDDDDRQRH